MNALLIPQQQNNQRYPQRSIVPQQRQQQESMEKLLPQSIDAECGVLGSIIIDPDAILSVSSFLKADDFYRDAHRTIYEVIIALKNQNVPADFITICETLEQNNKLEEVGGASYITSLINEVPTSGNVEYYGRIVERTSILRKLIEAAGKQAAMAYDASDAQEVLAESMRLLQNIANRAVPKNLVNVSQPLETYMHRLNAVEGQEEASTEVIGGIKTGYKHLDRLIFKAGFKKTNLVIIAARPGLGKTTMLLNIALHTARSITTDPLTGETRKRVVVVFSLEMSEEELINSLLAQVSGIDSIRLDPDILDIHDHEWDSLAYAENVLDDLDLYIDCTPGLNVLDIEMRVLKLQQELGKPVDLVCVDYLQRMKTESRKSSGNRVYDVSEMSSGLKDLAVKLNTVVLCATQLNRDLEKRANKEPQLSDMKDSGTIEQDANIVIAINREDEYDKDSDRQGIADIIVLKYRKGQKGRVEMFADYPRSRFMDIVVEGSLE